MSSSSKAAVAIVSGGMDSVTLAYLLASEGCDLHLLSFDYGQRHRKELEFAASCAGLLGARHDVVDLSSLTDLLKGSALTDAGVAVPDGHYAQENMKITVVPNRNAMMLAIAYAVAVAEGAEVIGAGIHAGDHAIYPDCRPAFAEAFDAMQRLAVEGFGRPDLHLYTPFVSITKANIVTIGHRLGVDYARTWSCYKGGEVHCGTCGTCVERKEAFELAGVPDPTRYAA
jgi:7-cyano-7-deazaguanine synthase